MYKEELYQGERVQTAPTPEPVQPRDVMSEAMARGMQQVAANLGQMMVTGMKMDDARNEFESERALMDLQASTQAEVQRRLNLPDGHDEAFFDRSGNIRQTQIQNLNDEVSKRLDGIGAQILDPVRRQQMQVKAGLAGARLLDSLGETYQRVQREKLETSWRDALDLARARGNQGEAVGLINRGVESGIITPERGELLKLRLDGERLRGLGVASRGAGVAPVLTVGGREYSGASAALALCEGAENMQGAEGRPVQTTEEVFGSEQTEPKPEGEQEPTATVDETAALTLSSTAVLPRESEAGAITLQPYQDPGRVDTITLQPVEFENAIDAIVRQPASEFAQMIDDLTYDNHILTVPDRMGNPQFSCRPTAPAAVQRVVAEAQETGEINPESCRSMVARLTMDAVAENPSATTEQIMKLFDKAGIYEALGGGDAAAGQLRTRAIVEEMRQRTNAGTTNVNLPTIQAMVAERINRPNFFRGHAFYDVWRNNPRLKKANGEYPDWDYPDNFEAQQAWSSILRVYKEYRRDFNPSLPILAHSLTAEDLHDKYVEEFEESAGEFIEWYMREMYQEEKKEAEQAATDYYMGAITEALRNNLSVDASGRATYGGYASEVSLAMHTLMTELPERPQDEVLTRLERTAEEGDATRSQALRLIAQRDYERLGRMREAHSANSARAAREAEKQQSDAAKAEEREAARRLHVARSTPRQRGWAWDRQNAPDGEQPMCTIPVAEYERLRDELGYDGSQLVYIRVGSTKVLVAGTNDTERIQLNTPAVMKIQPRPNQRRNERWRTRGDLGYSYVFSSTEAR